MKKQWEQWETSCFWAKKITSDDDCSHEIKTLAPWNKSYDKPRQCIKKQRHYFVNKGLCILKAMVFPVVMYRCESRTIKNAECWRIDSFELWCWRRLLRIFWTARRSIQLIVKAISPEYPLEGLVLKLQYFGYLMQRASPLEKTLMVGKIWGQKRAPED